MKLIEECQISRQILASCASVIAGKLNQDFRSMHCICIPGADKVSLADKPDLARGIRLPLHLQCFLWPWRPHLPNATLNWMHASTIQHGWIIIAYIWLTEFRHANKSRLNWLHTHRASNWTTWPCLVAEKFPTVFVTSNLRTHVWSIKYS